MHTLTLEQVQDVLRYIQMVDPTPAECDGSTRILSFLMTYAGIPHQPMAGHVWYKDTAIPLHYWIDISDGWRIDLRARLWFGSHRDVPHGLFLASNWKSVSYVGKPVALDPNGGAALAKLYILGETDHITQVGVSPIRKLFESVRK